MSSFSNIYRLLPIAICLMLPACGFHPVYGTSSGMAENSPIRAGVMVTTTASGVIANTNETSKNIDSNATNSMARQFTNILNDMLASPPSPAYSLEVSIVQSSIGLGVARDGTASRYNLVLNSSYKLNRIADNKIVDSGNLSSVTSYNNPNNQYFSTYISEQDARKRGIRELAELYRQRLISFIEKNAPPAPPLSTPPPDENCPKVC